MNIVLDDNANHGEDIDDDNDNTNEPEVGGMSMCLSECVSGSVSATGRW